MSLSQLLVDKLPAQPLVQELEKQDLPAGERVFLGALAVFLAPVAEEVIFRGILYPAIKQAGYPRTALWATSLLFGAIHQNLVAFVPLAGFSLLLIYLYEKTGSLWASITAHSILNFSTFAFMMLTAGPIPATLVK